MDDYGDPSWIDVDTVIGNVQSAHRVRGHLWTNERLWPNVTVLALANEITRLRQRPWTRLMQWWVRQRQRGFK